MSHLYLVLLVALAAVYAWRPLWPNLDFWAHAAVGQWIIENGRAPDHALYLWTSSEPWVAHSWLTQVTFYGLTSTGDSAYPYVVLTFTAVLVALPFVLAWCLYGRQATQPAWLVVPFGLGIMACHQRYQTRPELFSAVFLACLLTMLARWSACDRNALCQKDVFTGIAIVALIAVWANFHGGVVVGVMVLAATAACDLVQDRASRRARAVAAVAFLGAAAVTANPYGLAYWKALVPIGGGTFAEIREWRPLWRVPLQPQELVSAGLALVLALAAWALNRDRRWSHLCWLALLAGLYLMAQRNLWLFTIASLMVLAANSAALTPLALWAKVRQLRPAAPLAPPTVQPLLRWTVRLGVVAWVGLESLFWAQLLAQGPGMRPVYLEKGIIHFLRENQVGTRLYNDYENSSYLQWRLQGSPPLFIDLLNAYPDQLSEDYLAIRRGTDRCRALLDQYGIDAVVLTVTRPGPSLAPLADLLDRDRQWKRVYTNLDGVIWVRHTPENERRWGGERFRAAKTAFGYLEYLHKKGEP